MAAVTVSAPLARRSTRMRTSSGHSSRRVSSRSAACGRTPTGATTRCRPTGLPCSFTDGSSRSGGRHGKSFGAPFGEPAFAYVAEFEWDDKDAFNAAVRSDEFAASGKDAMAMGIPFTVTFVELT